MSLLESLTSGVSALRSFEKGLSVIGNNIANVLTTGFKGSTTTYSDNFSNLLQQSSPSPAGGIGLQHLAAPGRHRCADRGDYAGISPRERSLRPVTRPISASPGAASSSCTTPINNVDYVTRAGDFRLDDQGFMVTTDRLSAPGSERWAATYDATVVNGVLTYTQTAIPPAGAGRYQDRFRYLDRQRTH